MIELLLSSDLWASLRKICKGVGKKNIGSNNQIGDNNKTVPSHIEHPPIPICPTSSERKVLGRLRLLTPLGEPFGGYII